MATTKNLRTEFLRVSRMIARIEAKPQRELAVWTAALRELRAEREQLRTILAARRQELGKKIVDLRLWRDGRPAMPPPAADRAFLTLR
jgi:hypothetical protein